MRNDGGMPWEITAKIVIDMAINALLIAEDNEEKCKNEFYRVMALELILKENLTPDEQLYLAMLQYDSEAPNPNLVGSNEVTILDDVEVARGYIYDRQFATEGFNALVYINRPSYEDLRDYLKGYVTAQIPAEKNAEYYAQKAVWEEQIKGIDLASAREYLPSVKAERAGEAAIRAENLAARIKFIIAIANVLLPFLGTLYNKEKAAGSILLPLNAVNLFLNSRDILNDVVTVGLSTAFGKIAGVAASNYLNKKLFEVINQGQPTYYAHLLLRLGANANVISQNSHYLIYHAISNDNPEMVKFLLDRGVDVNAREQYGIFHVIFPISKATSLNNLEMVKLLLDRGADVNPREPYVVFPISEAVSLNNPEMVKLLLDRGADMNARDDKGRYPLYYAVKYNNIEAMEMLIKRGADVNARDDKGRSPLYYAIIKNNNEAAKLLMANSAVLNDKEMEIITGQMSGAGGAGDIEAASSQHTIGAQDSSQENLNVGIQLKLPNSLKSAIDIIAGVGGGQLVTQGLSQEKPSAPQGTTPGNGTMQYAATTMMALAVLFKAFGVGRFSQFINPEMQSTTLPESPYRSDKWQRLISSPLDEVNINYYIEAAIASSPQLKTMADAIENKTIPKQCSTWNKEGWEEFFTKNPGFSDWSKGVEDAFAKIERESRKAIAADFGMK